MKGEITYIKKLVSRFDGADYFLVSIKCSDGKYRKTYVSKSCRNFKQWKEMLTVGIKVKNLVLIKDYKGKEMINADYVSKDDSPIEPSTVVTLGDLPIKSTL